MSFCFSDISFMFYLDWDLDFLKKQVFFKTFFQNEILYTPHTNGQASDNKS